MPGTVHSGGSGVPDRLPSCGEAVQHLEEFAGAVVYRLFRLEDTPHAVPEAIAVSMPIPDPVLGGP